MQSCLGTLGVGNCFTHLLIYMHVRLLILFFLLFQLPGFTHTTFLVPFRLHFWFVVLCNFEALPAFWPPAPKSLQLLTEPASGRLRRIQASCPFSLHPHHFQSLLLDLLAKSLIPDQKDGGNNYLHNSDTHSSKYDDCISFECCGSLF